MCVLVFLTDPNPHLEVSSTSGKVVNGTLSEEFAHYYISHENYNHRTTVIEKNTIGLIKQTPLILQIKYLMLKSVGNQSKFSESLELLSWTSSLCRFYLSF